MISRTHRGRAVAHGSPIPALPRAQALRNYFRNIVATLKASHALGAPTAMTPEAIAAWKQSMEDALQSSKSSAPMAGRKLQRKFSYCAKDTQEGKVSVEELLKPKQTRKKKATIRTCESKVEQLMSDVMDLTRSLQGGSLPTVDAQATVESLSNGLKGNMNDNAARLGVLEDVQRENTKLLHKLLEMMKPPQ